MDIEMVKKYNTGNIYNFKNVNTVIQSKHIKQN
jgi:hypothetical protein